MFVNNPVHNDPRVKNESRHLVRAGYEVVILGRATPGCPLSRDIVEGARIIRVPLAGWRLVRLLKRALHLRNRHPRRKTTVPIPNIDVANRSSKKLRGGKLRFSRIIYIWAGVLRHVISWVPRGLLTRADAYHAHDLDTLLCAFLCARIRHRKLIYDSHELWIEWRRNGIKEWDEWIWWWKKIETRCVSYAHLMITVSDGIAEELRRLYDVGKPLVIRNCAPLRPVVHSNKLRQRIQGDKHRPIVLYQGGFVGGRGLKEFVSAADFSPKADFVLMGKDSPYKEEIKACARRSKNKNVQVLPSVPLDELWEYTLGADIGVVLTQPRCLSYALSEGNKVYEYMVAEIAIIASSIGSHKRLAEQTGGIAVVDPYNPRDIARAVNELSGNSAKMKAMGRHSRRWAETKYNSFMEMEKLRRAYDRLFGAISI